MKKSFLFLVIFSLCIFACDKDEPTTTPVTTDYFPAFEQVWNDFDQHYSYFIHKGINWDSLKTVYEPLAKTTHSYRIFMNDVLKEMLTELKDLHVNLFDKNGEYVLLYSRDVDNNYNYDTHFYTSYFLDGVTITTNHAGGIGVIDGSIGYIGIGSWSTSYQDDISEIESIFDARRSEFENYKGFIIDVRMNSGGSDVLAKIIASRFADKTALYEYTKTRKGPDHDDFYNPVARHIVPAGSWQFTKPVVVLIGERCMSSNESFILMMSALDHVTTIGDTTRGSSGNPLLYSLDDGTTYRIPSWVAYKPDMTVLEDTGIFPDITIDASESIIDGRDMVLEKAIEMLN
ncbi:hypothetical protein JW960_14605 [candidate division KSB1 bacterium]|nr:hypothetical protein [candidate division KSB1 bacterium]